MSSGQLIPRWKDMGYVLVGEDDFAAVLNF